MGVVWIIISLPTEVCSELQGDSSVDAAAMRTIAQTFTNCRYRDARTRSLALGAIWARHSSLMGAKARADAIGGRLAG